MNKSTAPTKASQPLRSTLSKRYINVKSRQFGIKLSQKQHPQRQQRQLLHSISPTPRHIFSQQSLLPSASTIFSKSLSFATNFNPQRSFFNQPLLTINTINNTPSSFFSTTLSSSPPPDIPSLPIESSSTHSPNAAQPLTSKKLNQSNKSLTPPPPATPLEPYQEFYKLDLRIGKINTVRDHPNADILYLLDCDLGELETRQVVTNIKPTTPKKDLEGKKLIFLTNIKPVAFRGEKTNAMIFGGNSGDNSQNGLVVPLNPMPGFFVNNKLCSSSGNNADIDQHVLPPGTRLFVSKESPIAGEIVRQNDKSIAKLMDAFSTDAFGALLFANKPVVVQSTDNVEIPIGLSDIANAKFA